MSHITKVERNFFKKHLSFSFNNYQLRADTTSSKLPATFPTWVMNFRCYIISSINISVGISERYGLHFKHSYSAVKKLLLKIFFTSYHSVQSSLIAQ